MFLSHLFSNRPPQTIQTILTAEPVANTTMEEIDDEETAAVIGVIERNNQRFQSLVEVLKSQEAQIKNLNDRVKHIEKINEKLSNKLQEVIKVLNRVDQQIRKSEDPSPPIKHESSEQDKDSDIVV